MPLPNTLRESRPPARPTDVVFGLVFVIAIALFLWIMIRPLLGS